jgi:hypothetical protein
MPALQPLCTLLGINPQHLSKPELILIEADLFVRICAELQSIMQEQNKPYFRMIKTDIEKENTMLESNIAQCLIKDILTTEEYTLAGIACYTDTPEEAVYDIAAGCNNHPTFSLARRVIELHRTVRPSLYAAIAQKIKEKMLESD